MNQATLAKLSENDLAAHIQVCFDTPSGEVVYELLRRWCFMSPAKQPESVETAEQATSRIGLTNLFRKIEYYRSQTTILKGDDDE